MLICDEDEPSPVSSDEVFFICEEQTSVKCDDKKILKTPNDKMKIEFYPRLQSTMQKKSPKPTKTDSEDLKTTQKKISNILSRKKTKKVFCDAASCTDDPAKPSQTFEKIITTDSDESHTILVKIQVENCSQCPDKSISVYSQDVNQKDQCKLKKSKTVAVQVNFNSIESAVDSQCVKISKIRRCSRQKTPVTTKGKKSIDNDEELERSPVASASNDSRPSENQNPTKIYLWRGKNFKSQSLTNKTNKGTGEKHWEEVTEEDKSKMIQEKSFSVDRGSFKKKKSQAISPNKKSNRSSLTIGSDNISINLSKYSPCASRLAASSKILGNNVNSSSTLSPESPLHAVRLKSPGKAIIGGEAEAEKMTLQASLSLNIDQLKRSNPTPRSRSVGDSCVTSPTSEATTTMSYSPTGTEILSLDEVGQTSHDLSVSAPDLKVLNGGGLTTNSKVNLETKC